MADSSQPGSILKNTGYINASTSSTDNNGEENIYESKGKDEQYLLIYYVPNKLGIQIRNMKMFFNFYCTWRWVTFEKLMMIYDIFFYSAKLFNHPV